MSLCNGVTPLSLTVAGPIADAVGVQTWFVIGAVVCIAGRIVGFDAHICA